jgi:hypothetical protein
MKHEYLNIGDKKDGHFLIYIVILLFNHGYIYFTP